MSKLTDLTRLWLGDDDAVCATRLFRHSFDIADEATLKDATLTLFADARYHLWINGTYLGRGPTFFHPHRRPEESWEVRPHLRSGRNTVAVLVHSFGISTHSYVFAGTPGLVAHLQINPAEGDRIVATTNDEWKVTDRTGWSSDVPRRTWAIGFVENYSAADAPDGWQMPGFDDSDWAEAEARPPFPATFEARYSPTAVPRLRYHWQPVRRLLQLWRTDAEAPTLSRDHGAADYARALTAESWDDDHEFRCGGVSDENMGTLIVENMKPDQGAVICLDLGAEYIGQVCFTMISESAGTVDVGWAELLQDGQPQLLRKGGSYVDRFNARPGENQWHPINFSAGRYVALILRGFTGRVEFRRLGMLASEPNIPWTGKFECDDEQLNAVWQLCARTVRVGVQEGLMDCPTREQATYVGDGNPNALWIGRLTGDWTHWRRLIRETFAVQREDGLIKTVPYSGQQHVLIDYELLAIAGVREYLRETGDMATVREVLRGCRRVMSWFLAGRNEDGLFAVRWEEMPRKAEWAAAPPSPESVLADIGCNLFIDHPGLGWHNRNDPGIDRRGLNAAINALLAWTCDALAEVIEACGETDAAEYRAHARRIREVAPELFWNAEDGAFADGRLGDKLLPQISQQTNTWCVMAGFCNPDRAGSVLRRILDPADAQMARSGPYFWYYMLPVLTAHGMVETAVAEVRRLWSIMLDADATTAWETFAGDELDSYCHPWSSVPADFLPRSVAGIGPLPQQARTVELHPKVNLLERVQASVPTSRGPISIGWKWQGDECRLSGSVPPGVTAALELPDGRRSEQTGEWSMTIERQGT